MKTEEKIIPGIAVQGIGTGLIMMAIFTLIWAGIAFIGLRQSNYWYFLLIFPVFSTAFVINAVKLFRMAKYFPVLTSEADIAEGKNARKWFGIIFGAEGLGIFIAINIVINLGHADLTVPVMALVVGLHFFPLAKVFKRSIDYYLASWSTLIAILAMVFVLNKTLTGHTAMVFTGTSIAIATTCYGLYMMISGLHLKKPEIA